MEKATFVHTLGGAIPQEITHTSFGFMELKRWLAIYIEENSPSHEKRRLPGKDPDVGKV